MPSLFSKVSSVFSVSWTLLKCLLSIVLLFSLTFLQFPADCWNRTKTCRIQILLTELIPRRLTGKKICQNSYTEFSKSSFALIQSQRLIDVGVLARRWLTFAIKWNCFTPRGLFYVWRLAVVFVASRPLITGWLLLTDRSELKILKNLQYTQKRQNVFLYLFCRIGTPKNRLARNIEDGKACGLLSFDHSLVFMTSE